MENNELMMNQDVIDTAEEVATSGTGKGLKIAAGVGLAALIGVLTYKFVAKPIAAKIKAKKEASQIEADVRVINQGEKFVSEE